MRIHIKATEDTPNAILSELMNILIKYKLSPQKYLGKNSKIVMATEVKQ